LYLEASESNGHLLPGHTGNYTGNHYLAEEIDYPTNALGTSPGIPFEFSFQCLIYRKRNFFKKGSENGKKKKI